MQSSHVNPYHFTFPYLSFPRISVVFCCLHSFAFSRHQSYIIGILHYVAFLDWHLSLTNMQFESEVSQSCLTLCDPVDYSLTGSSVCGIF